MLMCVMYNHNSRYECVMSSAGFDTSAHCLEFVKSLFVYYSNMCAGSLGLSD